MIGKLALTLALAALVAVCVVLVFGGKSGGMLKPDDARIIARRGRLRGALRLLPWQRQIITTYETLAGRVLDSWRIRAVK
ncbi:hypothetical protein [Mesorhizobium sp.]|uniref:hypothetical protein n=1 Tax=Mesorhizobium sp. TaxID=1871066 RepID=UPI000FE56EA7|nr:hypothetical protein [Mesorhizobium sp.]RWK56861.1 MAG: hypothetical protein EOR48_04665 [Mesorhizobium sp.]TIP42250.1 MAG: hypothetical protein E5X62_22885 [Mesorhizobium sp.]